LVGANLSNRDIILLKLFAVALPAFFAFSIAAEGTAAPQSVISERSGQSHFDWELGLWKTRVRVLQNPLSGEAPVWSEYEGTSVVKSLMAGRANFVELSVKGPSSSIQGGALRLYNPQTRQWSINYASARNGMLTAPIFGSFDTSGRGVFVGQDQIEGRTILVRFVITRTSAREARFVQAYSTDGGVTWEDNWVAVDTRQ
jgi:hypothetical protein